MLFHLGQDGGQNVSYWPAGLLSWPGTDWEVLVWWVGMLDGSPGHGGKHLEVLRMMVMVMVMVVMMVLVLVVMVVVMVWSVFSLCEVRR